MQVKSDYWMELGPLGECPVELEAIHEDGLVELTAVWLQLAGQKMNVLSMINDTEAQCLRDHLFEVHRDAAEYVAASVRKNYRHIDCHA
jgi:hypothetical protein